MTRARRTGRFRVGRTAFDGQATLHDMSRRRGPNSNARHSVVPVRIHVVPSAGQGLQQEEERRRLPHDRIEAEVNKA